MPPTPGPNHLGMIAGISFARAAAFVLASCDGTNPVFVRNANGGRFDPSEFRKALTVEAVWRHGQLESVHLIKDDELTGREQLREARQ